MIPKGLFSQIAMVVLSVAIIITYIKPEFEAIKVVQDDIAVYKKEREMVISVNSTLSTIKSRKDSIAAFDIARLDTYLPATIDHVSVARDLYLITKEAGVIYRDSSYQLEDQSGSVSVVDGAPVSPEVYAFSLDVEGTYGQLKNLLFLLAQNNYPLEITDMTITQIDGGFLKSSLSIVTYAYRKPLIDNQIIF